MPMGRGAHDDSIGRAWRVDGQPTERDGVNLRGRHLPDQLQETPGVSPADPLRPSPTSGDYPRTPHGRWARASKEADMSLQFYYIALAELFVFATVIDTFDLDFFSRSLRMGPKADLVWGFGTAFLADPSSRSTQFK